MADVLKMRCRCGATFEANMSTFINGGGAPDAQGRVFRMEVHADAWRDEHAACYPPIEITTADPGFAQLVRNPQSIDGQKYK